ncbi:MAG: hypothetical protein NZ805_04155 [Armatimonadetes bacterium]|nr:hypothetical protein [Armatimonadota bacterium]MDW8029364.1 hypothetical protein [Armatimonadota bacterium]
MDIKEIKQIKKALRDKIGRKMEETKVAMFPGVFKRIPNFVGIAEATRHLNELSEWRNAKI